MNKQLTEKKILNLLAGHGLSTDNKQIALFIQELWKQRVRNLDTFLMKTLEYVAGAEENPKLKITDKEKFAKAFPKVGELSNYSDWFVERFAFYCGLYGDMYVSYGLGEDVEENLMEKIKNDRNFFVDLVGELEMCEFEVKRIFNPEEEEILSFRIFEKRSEIADKLDELDGVNALQRKIESILTKAHNDHFSKWYRF